MSTTREVESTKIANPSEADKPVRVSLRTHAKRRNCTECEYEIVLDCSDSEDKSDGVDYATIYTVSASYLFVVLSAITKGTYLADTNQDDYCTKPFEVLPGA